MLQMKNIKPFAPALAPAISSFTQPVEKTHELKLVDVQCSKWKRDEPDNQRWVMALQS